MDLRACALGIREAVLTDKTAAVLKEVRPWGLILFREACQSIAQVQALCAQLRETVGHDAIVWIDQEGGRVARLKPPAWPTFPPGAAYGALYAKDPAEGLEAVRLAHRLIAHELKALGVNASFAPVLDTPRDGADPIIGDRALANSPEAIAVLGAAALAGLHDGGVAGCIKHIPGHGRADVDSHLALPRVSATLNELGEDFAPFRALAGAEAAMTAHILYPALDPDAPATHSPKVVAFIRQDLGFQGLLVSDDVDMRALDGPLEERARKAFAAGCDLILQCDGDPANMAAAAAGSPILAGEAARRAAVVDAIARQAPTPFDAAAGWWRLRQLLGPSIRERG